MEPKCIADAQAWLSGHTALDDPEREALARVAADLHAGLPQHSPWLLGLGGAPGTGKSTLAHLLAALAPGAPILVLSLDDYYLAKAERAALGRAVHPLLARRGVPGTHDSDRLFRDIDRLLSGAPGTVELPRFDKGSDDRRTEPATLRLSSAPAGVILEGWFVGTPPEAPDALVAPVNALERHEDPDGAWRRWVNERLREFHTAFRARAAAGWHLSAPGWHAVIDWRWRQEQELPPALRGLPDKNAVAGFLAPFERLCRHQFAHAKEWTDRHIHLDEAHRLHLECAP